MIDHDGTGWLGAGPAGGLPRTQRHEHAASDLDAALRALAEAAFNDINHLLRPGHLKQLRKILDDPEASANDKFVAYDFLKNANIAAGGALPMCQDPGTVLPRVRNGRLVIPARSHKGTRAGGPGTPGGWAPSNIAKLLCSPDSIFT